MSLIDRLFGKPKPDPKIKSKTKTKKAKAPAPDAPLTATTRNPVPEPANPLQDADAAAINLVKTLEARKSVDPYITVKACATEVLNRLILAMRDERGVHTESILCALGALGGFSCQMAARAKGVHVDAREKNGKTYYFGPTINKPLAELPTSILALAMGAAQAMGSGTTSPDVQSIIKHTIDTMGTNAYGIPRVPDGHQARDLPENYARALWPVLLPTIKLFCKEPNEWPIVFGYAVQQVMKQGKDALQPATAVKIVMEAAVPSSKLDPGPDLSNLI